MQILNDPFVMGAVQSAGVPLAAAFVLAWLIRRAAGPRPSGLAIGLAVLAAYTAILGMPPMPPVASTQKFAYVVLLGTALGGALDVLGVLGGRGRIALYLWPTLIVGWIGWRSIAEPSVDGLARLALLWIAGLFVFNRLAAHREQAIETPTMVLVASVAASVAARFAESGLASQLAAAVAAATGGYLLWNWPKQRDRIGWSVVYGAGSALYAAACILVLFSPTSLVALALLLLIFAVGPVVKVLPFARWPLMGPLIVGGCCAIPAIAAVVVAVLTAQGPADF